jgi:hypothetical protein
MFTTEGLAVMAILDQAERPLELEPWLEWVGAIAAALSLPKLDELIEPEHLVEQPPVRMAMEILLSPW